MSDFIVSIDFGGFSDSPPESNVMPLPTKTTVLVRLRMACSSAGPAAAGAPSPARRPRCRRSRRWPALRASRTCTSSPAVAATRSASAANVSGYRCDGLVLTRSRTSAMASASACARPAAAAASSAAGQQHQVGSAGGRAAAVAGELVAAEQRAERDRLGRSRVAGRQRECDRASAGSGAQCPYGRASRAAQRLTAATFPALIWLAEPHGDDQRRRERAAGGDPGQLILLAGGAQRGQGGGERAAERGVDVGRSGGRNGAVGGPG